MDTIGKIKLKNEGGFVAKLQCRYSTDGGNSWQHADGTGGITSPFEGTLDPSDHGVPDGSRISAYVFVVWGNDVQGREIFAYEKGNSRTAKYTIKGTTLDSSLSFNGIE